MIVVTALKGRRLLQRIHSPLRFRNVAPPVTEPSAAPVVEIEDASPGAGLPAPGLEQVEANWDAIVAKLDAVSPRLATVLASARPLQLEGHKLLVGFAESELFSRKTAESPANCDHHTVAFLELLQAHSATGRDRRGALSPIDGVDPEDLKVAELLKRVEDPAVREVVLATNPTTNGEATALYLADEIHSRRPDINVSRPASGLPVGADLEYTDEVTLGRALQGRRSL